MIPYVHPPRTAPEKETLEGTLDALRATVLWKVDGLSTEDAARALVPSGTSLLGIVKHLAWVEYWWFCDFIGGQQPEYPWSEDDPDADFRIEDDETVESIAAFYAKAVAEANAVIGAHELDATSERGGSGLRSLRWVITHMIDETARHAGQMDILRELTDDTTGYLPDT